MYRDTDDSDVKLYSQRELEQALVQERKIEGDAVEAALLSWVQMQSGENSHRLYTAALNYFGIKPVIPD